MKYILAALPAELPEHNLDSEQYTVWFTGVGKVNAAMYATLACAQTDCEAVINYGTAGTLTPELAGQLIQVGTVMQRDMDARPLSALGITPMDMELYAIAKVCKHFSKTIIAYKYVTDLADKDAAEHWEENHSKGAEAFLAMT